MIYTYILIVIGICLSIVFTLILMATVTKTARLHLVDHNIIDAGIIKIGDKVCQLEIRVKVLETDVKGAA
jgi:hypothetical protein